MPQDPQVDRYNESVTKHNRLVTAVKDILASYDANDSRGIGEAIESNRKIFEELKLQEYDNSNGG